MTENVTNIAAAHVQGIDLEYRAPNKPAHIKKQLPEPFLQDDADWLKLYWRTWSIAYDKIRTPDPATGLVEYCDAAFSHNIFQWDTCFMLRFLRYAPGLFHACGSLDNFYLKQHDDGFICREINSITGNDFWEKQHGSSINPPLFADAEWSLFLVTNDHDRVEKVLPSLCRYHQWLKENRACKNGGYWTTALGSGMDNSPRAHVAGGTDVHKSYGYTWMCMTVQMALSALKISQLANAVGHSELSDQYATESAELTQFVRTTFWNDEAGYYADALPDGSVGDVLTPAACWPLLLPGEPEDRVAAIEKALFDPDTMGRLHLVPSLSADHPLYDEKGNYWRGSVWPPMVYLAVRAMQENGRHDSASKISSNHLSMILEVFEKTGTFWENYAPDSVSPGQIARPEFVGWTGCGPIALLIEAVLGINVDAPARTVTWHIVRTDSHGLKNFRMGENLLSLHYEADENTVRVTAEDTFELCIHRNDNTHRFSIDAGSQLVRLP